MPEAIERTACALAPEGKGLLAADESFPTIAKRFEKNGIQSNPETLRAYRELLFTTPGVEKYLSGVILFDETIRQKTADGEPFTRLLEKKGLIPGIKVDKGTKQLAGFSGEVITEGLDGLRDRLAEYRSLGARFAKWRAVIRIGQDMPTRYALEANSYILGRYAALCQEQELVPIVEPEVLMEGDHGINRCEQITTANLEVVFSHLSRARVLFEGMLLKPNMILPGKDSAVQATPEEVAEATIRCLRPTVPAAVPGIVFLSGGQSPETAAANLNAIIRLGPHPWELTFSFSRALQEPVLAAWKGEPSNVGLSQEIFLHRAKCSSAARLGTYTKDMEKGA